MQLKIRDENKNHLYVDTALTPTAIQDNLKMTLSLGEAINLAFPGAGGWRARHVCARTRGQLAAVLHHTVPWQWQCHRQWA